MQANHLDAKIDLCGCVDLVLEIGDVLTSRRRLSGKKSARGAELSAK